MDNYAAVEPVSMPVKWVLECQRRGAPVLAPIDPVLGAAFVEHLLSSAPNAALL